MSLLSSVQSAVNRGAAAAERTSRNAKLKLQQNECMKKRQALAAQLGASLYEATKSDPGLRSGREALYDGIAEIDRQREDIAEQLKLIETQAVLLEEETRTYRCPSCGATVHSSDLFCSGCGTSVAEIKAASGALGAPEAMAPPIKKVCESCGASVEIEDAFCMSCGEKIDEPACDGD